MDYKESKPAINSHLDLFTLSSSDVSTTSSVFVPVYTTNSLSESAAPLEFNIVGVPNAYLNLAESYLYILAKVTNADGSALASGVDVSTSNFFAVSLFEILECYINGKLISSKNNYHYTAYLLAHLSYSKEFKASQLKSSLYYPDTNAVVIGDANPGYKSRKRHIRESNSVELISPIYHDLALQNRWILPSTSVLFKFKRAPAEFSLLSPVDSSAYLIKIQECTLFAKREIVHPRVIELHERALERSPALYPIVQNDLKVISLPINSVNSVTENIFSSSKIPQRLLIGFVAADSMTGKYSKNPWLFEDLNITHISLSIDNVATEYRNLNLSFNSRTLLGYQSLLTGLSLENKPIGIDRDSWLDGNVLFAFSLVGYDGDTNFYERSGNLKLEITFATGLTKPCMGIIFSQTQGVLKLNKFREAEVENQGLL